jgi:hypothetical protein
MSETTQVYQVFIKAMPEEIWDAITRPDLTVQYFHGARIETTPARRVSRGPDGSLWGDEEVIEYEPPLIHDRLEGAPKTAASVSGAGWMFVLSGLKTLVETGEALAR